jgi:hypothetical protein
MPVELFIFSLSETDKLFDKCFSYFVIHTFPFLQTLFIAGRGLVYIKKYVKEAEIFTLN